VPHVLIYSTMTYGTRLQVKTLYVGDISNYATGRHKASIPKDHFLILPLICRCCKASEDRMIERRLIGETKRQSRYSSY